MNDITQVSEAIPILYELTTLWKPSDYLPQESAQKCNLQYKKKVVIGVMMTLKNYLMYLKIM